MHTTGYTFPYLGWSIKCRLAYGATMEKERRALGVNMTPFFFRQAIDVYIIIFLLMVIVNFI
jgi:hypothetical protein